MKFGLIPEFIGRLPVVATVNDLDREALVRVLTEPKNSLVKQYSRLLDMDGVTLTMEEGALNAIADKAIERGTGARGLRAILEEILGPVMFEVPDSEGVTEVVISEECVTEGAEPRLISSTEAERESA